MEQVTLGMPGPWADDNREPADHYTTKIGGLPDWPIPNFSVGDHLLRCALCQKSLCLVSQIFTPVKSLGVEERVLYVFGCLEAGCGSKPSSWRVLRVHKSCNTKEVDHLCNGVVPSPSSSSPSLSKPGNDWRENLWSSDSIEGDDGASDDDIDLTALSLALSEAAASFTSSRKRIPEPVLVQKSSPIDYTSRTELDKFPALPCFYVYSQEEKNSKGNRDNVPICDKQIDVDDDDTGEEEKYEAESYEYDRALNADRTYLKFKKRLDAYPEQCFRYAGKPLLAATLSEEEHPGNCRVCGGSRQYEMQLMPTVLYYLQEATTGEKSISLESWNWMTLLVYTCSKSCIPLQDKLANEGWAVIEEAVVVQYDE